VVRDTFERGVVGEGAAVPSIMKSMSSVETVIAQAGFAARFFALRAVLLVVE
jgi:hypothetical protein